MGMEEAIEYALSEAEPIPPASPGRDQPSADEPPDTLTRREEEVAALAARGLTNRQIAQELVISEHTVHHHLTSILKKLGLRSRRQLAAWLNEQQPHRPSPA